MSGDYTISVGSFGSFNQLVAEIEFPGKLVVLIDEDKAPGEFEVTVHSLNPNSATAVLTDQKAPEYSVPLPALLAAINDATARLKALGPWTESKRT
jgi:hypothetical protein